MMKVSRLTFRDEDGNVTETKYMIEEVREHSWGRTTHPVMYPEHSRVGSKFVPILLDHEQMKEALDG